MKILNVKGLEFVLDDEDYERIQHFSWYIKDGKWAFRMLKTKAGRVNIAIGWDIIGIPPIGLTVDHIDRNPLNNAKHNLRFATKKQQRWNQEKYKKKGFKGVYFDHFHRTKKPWMARTMINGKDMYLGHYKTAEEASEAYYEAQKLHCGEFAVK